MKVVAPLNSPFPQNTIFAYQMVTIPLSTQWYITNQTSGGPKQYIILPKLKRGIAYRIKIFSTLTGRTTDYTLP